MLQNIRDNLQGTIAKVIIGAICVPFVLFGVERLIQGGGSNDVAEVNGEGIGDAELRQAILLKQRQIMSQMGDKIDPAMLQEDKLKAQALDSLINQKVLLLAADDHGIDISDAAIDQMIVTNKDFQVDGKFSGQRFQDLLRGAGFTAKMYKELMKKELIINQQSSGIAQSGFITQKEAQLASGLLNEKRDVAYTVLSIDGEKSGATVEDSKIKDYYDQHSNDFYSPEQVVAEYIELKIEQFFPAITDEELSKEYESVVANFTASEQRRVSHILLKTRDRSQADAVSKLKEIKARIEKGESFDVLAKDYSEDAGTKAHGGDLGFVTGGTLPKPLDEAAKSLAKGAVSEPVISDAGVHLLYLADLIKTSPPKFDEEKESIRLRLQKDRAAKAFVTASEKLADATFNAPDLATIAKDMKLELKVSAPIVRDTKVQEGIFSNRKVLDELFSDDVLEQNLNSDLIELVPGEHTVVVRAREHHPREVRPLDQVAAEIKQKLQLEQARANLKKKAEDGIATIKSGNSTNKFTWKSASAITRSGADLPFEILNAAFEVPAPPEGKRVLLAKEMANGDYAVIDVSNVKRADAGADDNMQIDAIKRFLAQNDGREAYDAWQQYLIDSATVEKKLK